MTNPPSNPNANAPLLHLVFGGELTTLDGHDFRDVSGLDIVGIFPNYETAFAAWKGAAQRTVDNAMMRYFIVHLHRLLEPGVVGLSGANTSGTNTFGTNTSAVNTPADSR